MVDELFSKVAPAEAERVKTTQRGAWGKWAPVIAALGDGSVLRVRIKINHIGALSRDAGAVHPGKKIASRATDDPEYRYIWLVAK